MFDSQSPNFPEPFSTAHVERLRSTYARVLPLVAVWVGTFLYSDSLYDPWSAAANGWIVLTLFAAWGVLRWLPGQTLLILRGALWLAFVGFCAGVFLDYNGVGRAVTIEPLSRGGEHYGLAVLIIAAHTLHAPAGGRLAGLCLWFGSSAAAIAGLASGSFRGTAVPGINPDVLRFVLAGAIALGLMDIFSQISGLQIRSAVQNSLLQQYALTDSLTKLPNRRAFQTACEKEFAAAGDARPTSLIVLDIDCFKQVNDTHGHDAGDRVLQQLAQIVRSVVRPSDYPVRWGGDEFAVLLPDSNLNHARLMAEKLRLTVESFPFDVGPVTVSLGTALLSSDRSVSSLFQRADKALYEAKRQGRNGIGVDHSLAAPVESVERLRLALDDSAEPAPLPLTADAAPLPRTETAAPADHN
jgi:diguanylate cyclase (GGDEF)-like protein